MKGNRVGVGVQWRLTWAAALATFLASLVVSPTIQAGVWLGASVIVIVLVALAGGIARHLALPRLVVTAITTAVALLGVTFLTVRADAVWGVLPGPAAWGTLSDLFREGTRVVWAQAPPVASTPGTTLLIVAGVAIVAVAVDASAVTWRRAGLAGIPLLTLYLVPASVLTDGVPWPLFAISAVGWLVLLLVESRDRLSRWGRTLSLRAGETTQPTPLHIGGTGRRLGAVALIVAVGVPVLLPAFTEGILGSGEGSGGDGGGGPGSLRRVVAVNPIVDLKRDISRGADVELLRYTTTDPTPSYLRLATLDRFDGSSWVLAETQAPSGQQASDGLPVPPGLLTEVSRTSVTTDISIVALNDIRLPLPYPVTRVALDGDWRWDAETFDVFSPEEDASILGLDYQATSLDIAPTATQLQAAGPPSVQLEPMLTVPASVIGVLKPIVDEVTAGTTNDYERALAMQNWLRDSFTYSLDTRSGNSLSDLEAFLQDRSGYCEQFAATMALMARVGGIPSRVQVGFTPGTQGSDGVWSVSSHDAHAWPELWFEGVGWVRFEPTPGGGDGNAAPAWAPPPIDGVDRPGGGGPRGDNANGPQPQFTGRQQDPNVLSGDERVLRRGGAGVVATTPSVADTARSLWWAAVLLVAAVSGLILAAPTVERRTQRRRRRNEAGLAAALEAAWVEIRDTMADLELDPRPQDTPRDLRARLCRRGDFTAADKDAVVRLAVALERSRYAEHGFTTGSDDDGAWVWPAADAVTSAMLGSVSSRTRRRAVWWPASGRQRLQLGWGRVGQRVELAGSRVSQWFSSRLRRPLHVSGR